MSDNREAKNTDNEIWRGPDEGNGDYYADSLHITAGGALGINCGGHVIVRPIKIWTIWPDILATGILTRRVETRL